MLTRIWDTQMSKRSKKSYAIKQFLFFKKTIAVKISFNLSGVKVYYFQNFLNGFLFLFIGIRNRFTKKRTYTTCHISRHALSEQFYRIVFIALFHRKNFLESLWKNITSNYWDERAWCPVSIIGFSTAVLILNFV